ncbi:MAG: hypothetical protein U0Y82_10595 [Thermoleophilia bacterium]
MSATAWPKLVLMVGHPADTVRGTATQLAVGMAVPQECCSAYEYSVSGPVVLYRGLAAITVLVPGGAPLALVMAFTFWSFMRKSRNAAAAFGFFVPALMPQASEPWPVLAPAPKLGSGITTRLAPSAFL